MQGALELKRPNILLISIDTLRADRLGCYGHPGGLTPNLDRIAESGIRFSQAITGGSWTQAAFPVLMTSTYASMFGGCRGPLASSRPAGVETAASNGYSTAGFVTSPLLGKTYGYDRGFQDFIELEPEETDPRLRYIKGGQALLRRSHTHRLGRLVGMRTRPTLPYVSAAKLNSEVYGWLEQTREPFFAWIHYMDVHWPYHLEEDLVGPDETARAWRDLAKMYEINRKKRQIDPELRERFIHLYERAVMYVDAQIGELLSYLRDSGRIDNTIIVVVSDHGEEFFERDHWGHVEINLCDEIIRVPLILVLPDEASGVTVEDQVSTMDLMPTMLELCGCPVPAGMLGESLVPLLRNGNRRKAEETIAVSERWRDTSHMIAVRTSDYKYLWDHRNPAQSKLYDLRSDPGELTDVSEAYPAVASRFDSYVHHVRMLAAQTKLGEPVAAPELDENVVSRLRDLGYLE